MLELCYDEYVRIRVRLRSIFIVFIVYILIGIVLNFILPLKGKYCSPCPPGALCGLCLPYEEYKFSFNEVATSHFWINVVVWPRNVFLYLEHLNDLRIGRTVRL
jgi:hypothetical protein